MSKLRKVEIKNNNIWEEINFSELKKGDTFRMFEPDGEPVKDLNNKTEFLATSDTYMSEKLQQYTIEVGKVGE
jgi:hypothetical protein